jgi:hypothetical protein
MLREHDRIELMTTLQRVRIPSFIAGRNGNLTWLKDAAKGDLRRCPGAPRKLRGEPATDYEIDVFTRDD